MQTAKGMCELFDKGKKSQASLFSREADEFVPSDAEGRMEEAVQVQGDRGEDLWTREEVAWLRAGQVPGTLAGGHPGLHDLFSDEREESLEDQRGACAHQAAGARGARLELGAKEERTKKR